MFFHQFLGNITVLGGESILQQANIYQYYSGAPTSNLTDALSGRLLDTMHSFVEQIQQGQKQNGWKGPVALGETFSFWVRTRACRATAAAAAAASRMAPSPSLADLLCRSLLLSNLSLSLRAVVFPVCLIVSPPVSVGSINWASLPPRAIDASSVKRSSEESFRRLCSTTDC